LRIFFGAVVGGKKNQKMGEKKKMERMTTLLSRKKRCVSVGVESPLNYVMVLAQARQPKRSPGALLVTNYQLLIS
jgi:hypothetical protein